MHRFLPEPAVTAGGGSWRGMLPTSGTTAASHVDLSPTLEVLGLGRAGALPGHVLGVPTVSPLQTAYWYDVQPALRSDVASAFYPAVITPSAGGTWEFKSIIDQFDPDSTKNPNLSTGGINDPAVARQRLVAAIARAKARNWHVQLYTNLDVIASVRDVVATSPVPIGCRRRRCRLSGSAKNRPTPWRCI